MNCIKLFRLFQLCNYIIINIFIIIKLLFLIINIIQSQDKNLLFQTIENITKNINFINIILLKHFFTMMILSVYYFVIKLKDISLKSKLLIITLYSIFSIIPFILMYFEYMTEIINYDMQNKIITISYVIIYSLMLVINIIDFILTIIKYKLDKLKYQNKDNEDGELYMNSDFSHNNFIDIELE